VSQNLVNLLNHEIGATSYRVEGDGESDEDSVDDDDQVQEILQRKHTTQPRARTSKAFKV
jgi:hypothetical protein